MISLNTKLKALEKLVINNSPVILTAVGVGGTLATALLTHKAAVKADRKIAKVNTVRITSHEPALSRKERVQLVWKHYIPPVVVCGLTITAIVGSNRISSKRAAALATALTISEHAITEYKEKVLEKFGEGPERKVRDEIAQDRVNANPPHEGNIMVLGDEDQLCMELYSGRYFRSSVEAIRRAVNDINYQINIHGSATLSDFYDKVGLPHNEVSDSVGWDVDKLMDVDIHGTIVDGKPCIAFSFVTNPMRYRFPK